MQLRCLYRFRCVGLRDPSASLSRPCGFRIPLSKKALLASIQEFADPHRSLAQLNHPQRDVYPRFPFTTSPATIYVYNRITAIQSKNAPHQNSADAISKQLPIQREIWPEI